MSSPAAASGHLRICSMYRILPRNGYTMYKTREEPLAMQKADQGVQQRATEYLLQEGLKFVCPASWRLMISREVIITDLQQDYLYQLLKTSASELHKPGATPDIPQGCVPAIAHPGHTK